MNYSESTKVVFERIKKIDPDGVSRIVGHILLQGCGELEMLRLAFSPENAIEQLIQKVKEQLSLSDKQSEQRLLISNLKRKFPPMSSAARGDCLLSKPCHLSSEDEQRSFNLNGSYFHAKMNAMLEGSSASMRLICANFSNGYCEHGGSCRFIHVIRIDNGRSMVIGPSGADEQVKNLDMKQFESQLVELLKCRRGIPVTVSSIPILYHDQYGKVLHVGCGLMQLVTQMSTTIRLIHRPEGYHCIILADDCTLYMKSIEDQKDEESSLWRSCQVYLTFPPHSKFDEKHVEEYFNLFGPVQNVRIPSQKKRMYGFVTFHYPDSAALTLTKINPHSICGAQVLVKPYRHKAMLTESRARPILADAAWGPFENMKLLQKKQSKERQLPVGIIERKHKLESDQEMDLPASPFAYQVGDCI